MTVIYKFHLPGISCINCVKPVEEKLASSKKYVIKSSVHIPTKIITIEVEGHDVPREDVKEYLKAMMDDVGVESEEISAEVNVKSRLRKVRDFFLSHWFQGSLGLLVGITLLLVSLFAGGLPLAAMIPIAVVSTLLTLLLGARSYYNALIKLVKTRVLTMDTLFAISTITILAVSTAAFFTPMFSFMYPAALLIFGFRHIGLAIEEAMKKKLKLNRTFQHLLPFETHVFNDKGVVEIRPLKVVDVDDVLLIHADEIIPVDGIALTEDAFIYDTIKTGAPLPRRLKKGELLISGMRLAEGSPSIRLQATATVVNSYLARLDKNIEKAHQEKAPIEEAATRILQYFIPAVLGIGIVAGLLVGCLVSPPLGIVCLSAIIISACPCILGLVPSLAFAGGMQKGAKHGVQFKSAKTLQAANAIDVVVFDLNGTLTTGVPTVCSMGVVQKDITEETLLSYAAAIEKNCSHAMAKAICAEAQLKKVTPVVLPDNTDIDESNHSGVRVKINEDLWVIGNETMMLKEGVALGALLDSLHLNPGESVVYIARQQQLLGYFIVSDPLRKDARHTVDTLHKLGKRVHICTGADENTARRYASLLGIPESHIAAGRVGMAENTTDLSKTAYIEELQEDDLKVSMIGDAPNDTLGIVKSDFSIAIESESGCLMAKQEAGAFIQGGSLLPVASAFVIAKQTVNNIKLNLGLNLAYNVVAMLVPLCLVVGLGFTFSPIVGAIGMIAQAVFAIWLVYRFIKSPLPHLKARTSDHSESTKDSNSYEYFNKKMKPECAKAPSAENDADKEPGCSVFGALFSKKREKEMPAPRAESFRPQFGA